MYVKCMKCECEIVTNSWPRHNKEKHNNLSWIEGEPEINLSDEKLVLNLLKPIYKEKKAFKCESCGTKLKSAVGFYSHLNSCGKEAEDPKTFKSQCEICGKLVKPVSMKSHINGVHRDKPERQIKIKQDSPLGSKRKSAIKAASLIEQLSTDVKDNETIVKNVEKVSEETSSNKIKIKRNQYSINKRNGLHEFVCRKCTFRCETKEEIINHGSNVHPEFFLKKENDDDNDNEFVIKDKNSNDDLESIKEDFDNDDGSDGIDDNNISADLSKTERDEERNYCVKFSIYFYNFSFFSRPYDYKNEIYMIKKESIQRDHSAKLYDEARIFDVINLTDDLENRRKYLSLLHKSVRVAFKISSSSATAKIDWKDFELFNWSLNNDVLSIFCGGPIWAADWLPIPNDLQNEDQYIAIASTKDLNYLKVYCENNSSNNSSIQFWNFGKLNEDTIISEVTPKLEMLLTHELGEIYQMEWCPSGCYEPNNRMGLLAVAASVGNVYVFSIPFNRNVKNTANYHQLNIVKFSPFYKLIFETEQYIAQVPLRVTWSKTLGHELIAAGFSLGLVCVWDVSTKSEFLKSFNSTEKLYEIRPIRAIVAHSDAVHGVAFSNINEHLLFTCSSDGFYKFWDLETSLVVFSERKERFTAAIWPSNSLAAIGCHENVFNLSTGGSILYSFRNFNYRNYTLDRTSLHALSVSYNEWNSYTLVCGLEGLISINDPSPLLLPSNLRNKKKRRAIISICEAVDLSNNGPNIKYNSIYDKFVPDHGIIFTDYSPKEPKSRQIPKTNRLKLYLNYPIQSVNLLSWNPNENASSFFVAGYQSGILRLRHMKLKNAPNLL